MPVETRWSSVYQRQFPLHHPDLVEKAAKMANWQEGLASQVFLSVPLEYEDTNVHGGQHVWLCNALKALTRDEVLKLHDSLVAGAIAYHEVGDHTNPAVRARLPHIYKAG